MPTPLFPSWYLKVAEKMIRERKNFIAALDELKIDLKREDAVNVENSRDFQNCLRTEHLRFANEIAGNPELKKDSAIGFAVFCIQMLMREGQWDKALEGINKLSRLAGWQGADSNVNIYSGLTAKEIEQLQGEMEELIPKPKGRPKAGGTA